MQQEQNAPAGPPRRGFLVQMGTVAMGAVSLLAPIGAGLTAFFDPLRRRASRGATRVPITTLDALPDDGIPRKFAVVADRSDAWTHSAAERIGAVYLRRMPGTDQVVAFNAVCPHAGCFIGYDPAGDHFKCPCHTSAFTLDGKVISPSPSPRGMDTLEAEVTEDGTVLVAFQDFYSGRATKDAKP